MTAPRREELADVLALVHRQARDYLDTVDGRPARSARLEEALRSFQGPLPERGIGAQAALEELYAKGVDATVTSAGPRCYHFVMGGSTPAALGADWLTAAWDQIAYAWVSSPLGDDRGPRDRAGRGSSATPPTGPRRHRRGPGPPPRGRPGRGPTTPRR